MLLSIIIPIYNVEKYLRKCLDSILQQTFMDYEVILVNDGSPDNSAAICEEYVAKDSRFRLVNQKNAGPGAARNHGLDEAQGEYICFIDSDDWVEQDYLASFMAEDYDGVDAVFWGYTENKPDETIVRKLYNSQAGADECDKLIHDLKNRCAFGYTWSCRLKKSIIDELSLRFFTDIRVHEDACFINAYCSRVRSAAITDNVGYHYMQYSESSLSRRFYPSDEALRIAEHLLESTKHWHSNDTLGTGEIYTYLSKLNLAVMNMYCKQDSPQKSYSEKLARIAFVKSEVKKYYSQLGGNIRTTHKIFALLPVCVIDLIYRFK